jgi:hypothetical protein
LDFGIDSSFTQSNSNYFSNFISVLYDKHFAANAEFIFIRVQNWGIRTIVRHFFNVPLFNNYTQLLNGCRKKKINFSFNANILLSAALSGVKTDYEKYSNFKIANSEKIHYKFFELTIKIFKSLPTPLKQRLKSIFKI